MKITTILLFTALFQVWAAESYSQTAKVSVQAERMALSDLFRTIENQSEFLFFYVDSDIKGCICRRTCERQANKRHPV